MSYDRILALSTIEQNISLMILSLEENAIIPKGPRVAQAGLDTHITQKNMLQHSCGNKPALPCHTILTHAFIGTRS